MLTWLYHSLLYVGDGVGGEATGRIALPVHVDEIRTRTVEQVVEQTEHLGEEGQYCNDFIKTRKVSHAINRLRRPRTGSRDLGTFLTRYLKG